MSRKQSLRTLKPKKNDEAAKKKIAKLITDLRLDSLVQDCEKAAFMTSQSQYICRQQSLKKQSYKEDNNGIQTLFANSEVR